MSTLVKMPHCWKSHVAAHLVIGVWSVHRGSVNAFSVLFLYESCVGVSYFLVF